MCTKYKLDFLYLSTLWPITVCGKSVYDYNASLISVCSRPFGIDRWLRISGGIAIAFSGDREFNDMVVDGTYNFAGLLFDCKGNAMINIKLL